MSFNISLMRDAGGKRNRAGETLLAPDEIGVLGAPKSGVTGLVRSLVAEACTPVASRFAADWRLEPLGAADTAAAPDAEAIDRQRHELLAYFAAGRSAAQGPNRGPSPQSDFNDPAIRRFAVIPRSSEKHRDKPAWRAQRRAKYVKVFDTSVAGDASGRQKPGWIRHVYQNVPHIILCHPLFPRDNQQRWYKEAFDDLHERVRTDAGDRQRLRTLVVAFTGYEQRFVLHPQQAARRAATASVARDTLRKALDTYPILREGLRALSDIKGLRTVVIPVSTYGFVLGDGRPNCDLPPNPTLVPGHEPFADIPAPQFLTRPDVYCGLFEAARDPLGTAPARSSSDQIDWLVRHWRPFQTADAFIACASGESHELIFAPTELLETERIRQVT